MDQLLINEIYKSVQGESSFAGIPCIFVRLTGCPLRCTWCDTTYGFKGGVKQSIQTTLKQIDELTVPLVELTGGEPLAQKNSLVLMQELVKKGKKVLLETSGSISVAEVPEEVHIIMDIKCPDSKMLHKNYYKNFDYLKSSDEIKFVLASREDYVWAKDFIKENKLESRFKVLLSPSWEQLDPKLIVEWLLEDKLDCRLNLQIHKYIWDPKAKGV